MNEELLSLMKHCLETGSDFLVVADWLEERGYQEAITIRGCLSGIAPFPNPFNGELCVSDNLTCDLNYADLAKATTSGDFWNQCKTLFLARKENQCQQIFNEYIDAAFAYCHHVKWPNRTNLNVRELEILIGIEEQAADDFRRMVAHYVGVILSRGRAADWQSHPRMAKGIQEYLWQRSVT